MYTNKEIIAFPFFRHDEEKKSMADVTPPTHVYLTIDAESCQSLENTRLVDVTSHLAARFENFVITRAEAKYRREQR